MKRIKIAVALLLSALSANAQVVINEIMQSNIDCVMDELNEFPDSWVELYNASSEAVDLSKYSIGLSDKASEAWQLPKQMLAAKGYVLVWCDKEGKGLHTPFRLDSGKGGAVYLFNGETVEDKVTGIAKQPAPNIAYGRQTDGADKWGYQQTPTPKQKNCGKVLKNILPEPVFKDKGRIFENVTLQNYTVEISLPEGAPEGTEIRYTTDGSEPSRTSLIYSKPLSFSKTQVIRAKLFCDGWLSPRSTTASYILHPRKVSLPVVSIVTDKKYFFDDKMGIYVTGSYSKEKENFRFDWRRPINFEYFEKANAESELNQLCETRISGNASRSHARKSLALYANKRFGEKQFKHEFFPGQRPGLTKYKSIVLRNAGNDFDYLYVRDAIAQRSMSKYVDLDWQAYQPAIIYINGEYYGLLNIRERANEDNIFTNYDGLEDIDGVENWYDLKEGDLDNIKAFQTFFNDHGHTWEEYAKWMDVDEYINLIILNSYYNNVDFFGNNLFMWRPREEGGRWRFVAKDVDYIMGLYGGSYNYKYFNWIYDNNFDPNCKWANTADATRLFRRLMEDKDFNRRFIDRFAVYMGDFLNYNNIWSKTWKPMYDAIKDEYPSHRALVNVWWPNYSDELKSAQNWLQNRTNFLYSHLAEYFKLGTPKSLAVNSSLTSEVRNAVNVEMNEVKLSQGMFSGKFFQGRNVTLKASSVDPSKQVTGWKLTVYGTGNTEVKTIDGETCSFTMPEASSVSVNVLLSEATGIENVSGHTPSASASAKTFDLAGRRTSALTKGLNIVVSADGKRKKVLVK